MASRPNRHEAPPQNLRDVLKKIEEHLAALRADRDRETPTWLTVSDAARHLQVSRDTMERLIASGALRVSTIATRLGKGVRSRYRFKREWLDDYLNKTATKRFVQPDTRSARRQKPEIDFIGD
ncbi:MAG: helix-turn-helix domain-containing protein [Planctomycetes bacterium]|nr:helix-turn-helix domain-containing protein [Planctomycetota bacterium]